MTKAEVIGKLEMLLALVRSRAVAPHRQVATAGDAEIVAEATALPGGEETFGAESLAEARASDGHDSRERLVAAQPPAALHAEPEPVVDAIESATAIDVDADVVAEDEEPPSSSRRTVVSQPEERLEQMAFGAEEPEPRAPLHTPPPESGRLPHVAYAEFDPDVTGVRGATPLLPRRPPPAAPSPPPDLVPEEIRPQLVPTDTVAEVIAEAQRFAPATFVALLEASLSL